MGIGTGKKECQEGTVLGRVGMGVFRYILSDRGGAKAFSAYEISHLGLSLG